MWRAGGGDVMMIWIDYSSALWGCLVLTNHLGLLSPYDIINYGRVEEGEADSKGPQKLKNVAEKSWYSRVEEVEEVEADSKGLQKQHHPSKTTL